MLEERYGTIIDELYVRRGLSYSKKVNESVANTVKNAVVDFFKEQKAPTGIRNRINNILNFIYDTCDSFGDNSFVGGTKDYSKGNYEDKGDAESGPNPELFPSIYETKFQIRFTDGRQDFTKLYNKMSKALKEKMKSNFKDFDVDPFAITMCIDSSMNDLFGFYVSVEKYSKGFTVCLGNQVSPLHEAVGPTAHNVIKFFNGKDPWDRFEFRFSRFNDRSGKSLLKVYVDNTYWDKSDYAFVDISGNTLDIHSYSNEASEFVLNAMKKAGWFNKKKLEPIAQSLNVLSEGATSVFGQEIGLPIDKENCEGTDVSGVSTPTGTFTNSEDKKKKVFGEGEEEEKELVCPECKSKNINIHNGTEFHCVDCGHEWKDVDNDKKEEDERELKIDSMLDNSKDETPADYYGNQNLSNVSDVNIVNGNGVHESASEMRNLLDTTISKVGEVVYNGSGFIEVETTLKSKKEVIKSIVKSIKPPYRVATAGNRISVEGAGEFNYMNLVIKPKTGSNDTYVIDYDIPI